MTVANEYATLPELRAFRGITATDPAVDTALQAALTRASRAIDRKAGRRFWLDPAPVQRVFNPQYRLLRTWDGQKVLVDDIGATAGLVVEIGYGTDWTPITDYDTAPDNALTKGEAITSLLCPYRPWVVWPRQRIRITARWGWPAVPDEINQATLILANRLYLRKDTPEGVKGSADWGVIRLSRWDPDVESLVGPYTLPGIA